MTAPGLLPGAEHFRVVEEPAYPLSGSGEHLFVEIEKEGMNTEAVAEALARALGRKPMDVGFAGRKDRHAITRQWFSIHFGDETKLAGLPELAHGGRVTVTQVARHANKLRLGHLAGNRFILGLTGDTSGLAERLARLAREGIRNRCGSQRFGIAGANLTLARAWGRGDLGAAAALAIDPHGGWKFGSPLPEGFIHGHGGRVVGALRRRPDDAAGALRAAGDQLRKMIASAAQSAVFNAILDAREAAGLLHRLRVGDVGATTRGAPFLVTAEALDDTNRRTAPGVLDAFATAPMPGTSRLGPSPEVDLEERAWSAPVDIDWRWFATGGALESPGERRALIIPFRAPPELHVEGDITRLSFSLPSGSYATEVLEQVGVTIPADRRG